MESFARMARQSCTECGSRMIKWTTVEELIFLVLPKHRKRVIEGTRFFGSKAEAWKCGKCFAFGIFGPTELAL